MRLRRLSILLLCLSAVLVARSQTLVYLEHSETLQYDQERIADAQILRGNVIFRHDSALMYCDSAYFYEKTNSLDAFGHVRFEQGDTLRGYGDRLYYDGNTKVARLRRHVRLVHGTDNPTILTTDSLNYHRTRDLAYYYSGGTIRDSLNTLQSVWGQYQPKTSQAVFSREVVLTNPRFVLRTDTLLYNTDTKIADLVSPTTIVYEEETTILSSRGWYNTDTEQSMLLDRSQVVHEDGKTMTGDTIYYDKLQGYGRIRGHMEMRDTAQHITLYGHRGEMFRDGEYGYATDSALMVDYSDSTNYSYMHADTLYTEEVAYRHPILLPRDSILRDSILIAQMPDTLWRDTTYRRMRAYRGVRIYRNDLQSVCDSLVYNGRDSIMSLYQDPVCWTEENQISADTIHIYMRDGTVDYAHGIGDAMTVKQETADYYDQMAGKEMIAYIREDELQQVDVNGNALTIFYPKEEDGSYIGVNTTQSSYVKVYLEDQQIHHIVFTAQTTGVTYPMDQVPAGRDKLNGFFWADGERPHSPMDVFAHPARTVRPKSGAVSATDPTETEETQTDNPRRRRDTERTGRRRRNP